jgi:hypothetical protein
MVLKQNTQTNIYIYFFKVANTKLIYGNLIALKETLLRGF